MPIKKVRGFQKKRKDKDKDTVPQSVQQLAPRARQCERE